MPQFDLVDETFVVAPPSRVAAVIRQPDRWPEWWPDLDLAVFQDRGDQGIRWNVAGALAGSMEVWLEPFDDGVILHYYLRCDPVTRRPLRPAALARVARRRQLAAKRLFWRLKDDLEHGRRPGEPAGPASPSR